MTLIDDGTLDTVVSVEGTQYRYTWVDDEIDETYDDFVAWAMEDAVEMYEIDLETLADHYREKGATSPRRALNWVRYTLKEIINGLVVDDPLRYVDEEMLKQGVGDCRGLERGEVSA